MTSQPFRVPKDPRRSRCRPNALEPPRSLNDHLAQQKCLEVPKDLMVVQQHLRTWLWVKINHQSWGDNAGS